MKHVKIIDTRNNDIVFSAMIDDEVCNQLLSVYAGERNGDIELYIDEAPVARMNTGVAKETLWSLTNIAFEERIERLEERLEHELVNLENKFGVQTIIQVCEALNTFYWLTTKEQFINIFGAELSDHLLDKWTKYNCDVIKFFAYLDRGNREKFAEFILEILEKREEIS